MSGASETLYDLGWRPGSFMAACDNLYAIQNRRNGRYERWGPLLMRNKPQARFLRAVMERMKRGGPTRVIVLKSRKVGVSTAVAGLFYHMTTTMPGMSAGVMAHSADSTKFLFGIVRGLHENMPPKYRPQARAASNTGMSFGERHVTDRNDGFIGAQSRYLCATAGGRQPLAGTTLRLLHLSEVAHFPGDVNRQRDLILNVMNAVATEGPSIIIEESTANGMSGIFYETYARARGWLTDDDIDMTVNDGVDWMPFFSPWFEDAGNAMPVPAKYDWTNWPKEDREREASLVKRFSVTPEQLMFRRFKILNDSGGPIIGPDRFAQEYPSDEREAFMASGTPAIPKILMDRQMVNIARPQIYTTTLAENDEADTYSPLVIG